MDLEMEWGGVKEEKSRKLREQGEVAVGAVSSAALHHWKRRLEKGPCEPWETRAFSTLLSPHAVLATETPPSSLEPFVARSDNV